jgi:hypothetical protein
MAVEFPANKCIFCFNEVTLGGYLDSFRIGAGQKDQAILEAWNFQSHPRPLRKGKGLEVDLIFNHVCVMNLHKNP